MAKVKFPLLSGDARGKLGKGVVYRRGGVVSRSFTPRNPSSAAQQAQREYFLVNWVGRFMFHKNLQGLDGDDHLQYLTEERGDGRYLRELPEIAHSGLLGLSNDDHPQYLTSARADLLYKPLGGEDGIPLDGWVALDVSAAYYSDKIITLSGDVQSLFEVGCKVKILQGTSKYYFVVQVVLYAGNTLIVLNPSSQYPLTTDSIEGVYISRIEKPSGYPAFFTYFAELTGGTPAETVAHVYYNAVGRLAFLKYRGIEFTSNATTFTVSVPFASVGAAGAQIGWLFGGKNSGAWLASPSRAILTVGQTSISLTKAINSALWTASGIKGFAGFEVSYFF